TRVEDLLARGLAGGGEIAAGGHRVADSPGYFFAPTLVVDLPETSPLLQEEVFGPVIAMVPYDDVDDAVRIANGTEFGLAGYVWSASTERAQSVARRLRTGMLGINGGMFTGADMPFGGRRSSGMGREWGVEGLEEFLDVQTLAMRIPD
ncbi:MAG: aldehyde dehydrogenase family protein, partial [Miltoncostaeaceae bacterium]